MTLHIQIERIEIVLIKCPVGEKEQAEEFCRTHEYIIESREERGGKDGRIFFFIEAYRDISNEPSVAEFVGVLKDWVDGDDL